MIIGINGNEANVKNRVGVGQYAFEIIKHIGEVRSKNEEVKTYLKEKPLMDFPGESRGWSYEVFGPEKKWTLLALQKKLLLEKLKGSSPNVFFTPTHYAPLLMPIPSVISIMDLSFETMPQYFKKSDLYQLKYWTKISASQAKRIITISEFSKREICRLYAIPESKVVVTPLAYDSARFNDQVKTKKEKVKSVLTKYKIHGDYFLFVGTLQPKKNLTRLVEALALMDKEIKLVIVGMSSEGRGGWMYDQFFQRVKDLNLEKQVISTGYVPDEEIPLLMSGCLAFVLPSMYEGFGIPALEAMAVGVPVVVSNVTSLPEVCGSGAFYINDPESIGSIKDAMQRVLGVSPIERETRIKFGLEWVKRYNWQATAKLTLQVLYECI